MTVTTWTPLPLERVQIDRERRDQRLAFAGLHLGDLAAMKRDAADQLDVIVTLAERPDRRLANRREGLRKQILKLLAVGKTLTKQLGLTAKLIVGQRLDIRTRAR